MRDLALTTAGMPAIVLGGVRYPLLFSVSSVKEWAEYKDVTFQEAVTNGWKGPELGLDDTEFLLRVAMRAGDRRRVMFEGGSPREIGDDLITSILDLMHPAEVWGALVVAWDYAPQEPPDPPTAPENPPPGEPSSA